MWASSQRPMSSRCLRCRVTMYCSKADKGHLREAPYLPPPLGGARFSASN